MYSKELNRIVIANGFKKKKKSFFRVYGDNILQILQFEKERAYHYPMLYTGLLSLYSTFDPFALTPMGFIARYSVTDFFQGYPKFVDMPCEEQLYMLDHDIMPILNNIRTQKELLTQMCECDKNDVRDIIWNDSLKIAPALCSGMYEKAVFMIDAIIEQNRDAICSRAKDFGYDETTLKEDLEENKEDLEEFYQIKDYVSTSNYEAISNYLQGNLHRNLEFLEM